MPYIEYLANRRSVRQAVMVSQVERIFNWIAWGDIGSLFHASHEYL